MPLKSRNILYFRSFCVKPCTPKAFQCQEKSSGVVVPGVHESEPGNLIVNRVVSREPSDERCFPTCHLWQKWSFRDRTPSSCWISLPTNDIQYTLRTVLL